MKYFRYFLEGRNFKIMTDHKPLRVHATFRKGVTPETETNVISQFITRMEYLSGNDNISRIEAIRLPAEIK